MFPKGWVYPSIIQVGLELGQDPQKPIENHENAFSILSKTRTFIHKFWVQPEGPAISKRETHRTVADLHRTVAARLEGLQPSRGPTRKRLKD